MPHRLDDPAPFYERITIRDLDSRNQYAPEKQIGGKCCFRPIKNLVVVPGNHIVKFRGKRVDALQDVVSPDSKPSAKRSRSTDRETTTMVTGAERP